MRKKNKNLVTIDVSRTRKITLAFNDMLKDCSFAEEELIISAINRAHQSAYTQEMIKMRQKRTGEEE